MALIIAPKKIFFFPIILLLSTLISTRTLAQFKSLQLECPLENFDTVKKIKPAFTYAEPDRYITLVSITDSVVKAVTNGKITNSQRSIDGKYDIVLFTKINNEDYYIWYSGIERPLVNPRTTIKAGQPIAITQPGSKFDVAIYKFEEEINIRDFFSCEKIAGKPDAHLIAHTD